jgi:hypothetical protein
MRLMRALDPLPNLHRGFGRIGDAVLDPTEPFPCLPISVFPGKMAGTSAASPPLTKKIRRYWASIEIDPLTMSNQSTKIGQEIVKHLAALYGANVKITLDIQVSIPDGIPDDIRRVVNENSQTLKFNRHGFEKE